MGEGEGTSLKTLRTQTGRMFRVRSQLERGQFFQSNQKDSAPKEGKTEIPGQLPERKQIKGRKGKKNVN